VPGHTFIIPDRLELGRPLAFAAVVGGIGRDTYGFRWADSAWVVTWRLGYGVGFLWPVAATPGRFPLVWKGFDQVGESGLMSSLVMAEAFGDSVTTPDTVSMVYAGTYGYSAAVASTRRWVGASDQPPPRYGRKLRLLYSDTVSDWNEVEVSGLGDNGVAVTALDDTTALVAWAGTGESLKWGRLRGAVWDFGGAVPMQHPLVGAPQFRKRHSGGWWLGWAPNENHVTIAAFRDGLWSVPESLRCAYRRPEGYYSQPPDLSRDPGEYPAVAWSGDNRRDLVETICVCIPTDSGFTVAENLENSEFGILPKVARDRNGDVWVAWGRWRPYDGMYWTHTYTKATTSTPVIQGAGNHRMVSWVLSEPAPETWWAVLRARGESAFEAAARVRAGASLDLSWTDTSPPAGVLRYRIRRESVDTRYLWESPEARWPSGSRRPLQLALAPSPFTDGGLVQLSGAEPGPLDVRVYDLQGRLVLRQQPIATGSGQDSIRLDFSQASRPLAAGVYFLRVRDSSGQLSGAGKLVLLR